MPKSFVLAMDGDSSKGQFYKFYIEQFKWINGVLVNNPSRVFDAVTIDEILEFEQQSTNDIEIPEEIKVNIKSTLNTSTRILNNRKYLKKSLERLIENSSKKLMTKRFKNNDSVRKAKDIAFKKTEMIMREAMSKKFPDTVSTENIGKVTRDIKKAVIRNTKGVTKTGKAVRVGVKTFKVVKAAKQLKELQERWNTYDKLAKRSSKQSLSFGQLLYAKQRIASEFKNELKKQIIKTRQTAKNKLIIKKDILS